MGTHSVTAARFARAAAAIIVIAGCSPQVTATENPGQIATAPAARDTPTITPTLEPLKAAAVEHALHPCTDFPEEDVRREIILSTTDTMPPPSEAVDYDPNMQTIEGTCTYSGIATLRIVVPGPGVDVRASFEASLDEPSLEIFDNTFWQNDILTYSVLRENLWYSVALLIQHTENLFQARDLASRVQYYLSDTVAPEPTRPPQTPVAYIDPCLLVTDEEAAVIIGSLDTPAYNTSGVQQACTYASQQTYYVVGYIPSNTTEQALDRFQSWRDAAASVEDVPDLGDGAFWREQGGNLSLVVVADVYVLTVSGGEREAILGMAQTALARLLGETQLPTPYPTQEPTPDFDACNTFSDEQIESLIGPLTREPEISAMIGEEVGYFTGCTYKSAASFVIVSYMHFFSAERAREFLGTTDQEFFGLGDANRWDEPSQTLCAARGVLYICITGLQRDKAVQAMGIALVRIP